MGSFFTLRGVLALLLIPLVLVLSEVALRRYTDVGSPILVMAVGAILVAALVLVFRKYRGRKVHLENRK